MNRSVILSCFCISILVIAFAPNLSSNERLSQDESISPNRMNSISSGNVEFTWTSRDSLTPSQFTSDEIYGDHITIHATSSEFPVLESLLYFNPWWDIPVDYPEQISDTFDPFTDEIEAFDGHFTWFMLGGGPAYYDLDIVILFEFSNSNCDVFAWSGVQLQEGLSYSNNLLGSSMATASLNPEIGTMNWPDEGEGSLYIAIYNQASTSGTGWLSIFLEAYPDESAPGQTVSYDTYNHRDNFISPVLYAASMGIGSKSFGYLSPTLFVNLFPPEVEILTPSGGEVWDNGKYNITWLATDRNSDDEIWFELNLLHNNPELSVDLGQGTFSFDSAEGYYYHTIDATGIDDRNFRLQIIAHDNDTTLRGNWPDMQTTDLSGEFSFGDGTSDLPPGSLATINHPPDIQYYQGVTGNRIEWIFNSATPLNYAISVNDGVILEDTWTEGAIVVIVDHLLPGVYNYSIESEGIQFDSVLVTVLSNSTAPTVSNQSTLLLTPMLFIQIGLSGMILIVFVLIIKQKQSD